MYITIKRALSDECSVTIKSMLPEERSIKEYAQRIRFKGEKPTSYEKYGDLYTVLFDCASITDDSIGLLVELATWCRKCLALHYAYGYINLSFASSEVAKEFLDNLPDESC